MKIWYSDFVRAQSCPFELDSETQMDVVFGIVNSGNRIGNSKAITSELGQQGKDGIFFVFDNFTTFSSVLSKAKYNILYWLKCIDVFFVF